MDEPDNVSVETLISTHLYHVKTPLNMQYVVLHNVQHHRIIMFLFKLVFVRPTASECNAGFSVILA